MAVISQSGSADFHSPFCTSLTLTTLLLNTFLLGFLWSSTCDGSWCTHSAQNPVIQELLKKPCLCWSKGTAITTTTKKGNRLSELRNESSVLKLSGKYLILLVVFLPTCILIEVNGIFTTELNKGIMEHCKHHSPGFSPPLPKMLFFPCPSPFLLLSFFFCFCWVG